jgi:flagellar assembly factor FliW
MKIATKAYGAVELDERQRLHFPEGVLGFVNLRDWVLMDAAEQPFYWLQSVERQEVAFVLLDPRVFRPDYAPGVEPEELAEIGIQAPEDSLLFSIVTVPEDPNRMTANLQGPVIINRKTRVGRQCVSLDPRWHVRHVILEEMGAVRQQAC